MEIEILIQIKYEGYIERQEKEILKSERFAALKLSADFDFSKIGKVDIIFHLASPASPVQYIKHPVETMTANSQGTKNLLDFMLKTKSRRFVF